MAKPSSTTAPAHTTRNALPLEGGAGHHAHTHTASARAGPAIHTASACTPSAAPGSLARCSATQATASSGIAASHASADPAVVEMNPISPAHTPAPSESVTSGVAITLATGATRETMPKTGTDTGTVAAWAMSVRLTGSVSHAARPPVT